MKSCDEMTRDVLSRSNAIMEQRKKKEKRWQRILSVVITGCLVLGIGGALWKNIDQPNEPTQGDTHNLLLQEAKEYYTSMDKVNYDAAFWALTLADEVRLNSQPVGNALSAASKSVWLTPLSDEETYDPTLGPTSPEIAKVKIKSDISGEEFCLVTAVHFQLNVTEETEFLAKRVGVGTVDVAMTRLYIGTAQSAILTFKNGERYYSCVNYMGVTTLDGLTSFWTTEYIEGFDLVNDTTGDFVQIDISYDEDIRIIQSVSWAEYRSVTTEMEYFQIEVVENSTETSDVELRFNLLELYDYFRFISGEYDDPTTKPKDPTPDTPVQKQQVIINNGTGELYYPREWELERTFFDQQTQTWMRSINGYDILDSFDQLDKIPSVELVFDPIMLETIGTMGDIQIYKHSDDGKIESVETYSPTDIYLKELPSGQWYIVFTVQWQDDYIEPERQYETHTNIYLFLLEIKENSI